MARIRNALAGFVALPFVGGIILPTQATAATVTYTITGNDYNFTVTNNDYGWTITEIVVTPFNPAINRITASPLGWHGGALGGNVGEGWELYNIDYSCNSEGRLNTPYGLFNPKCNYIFSGKSELLAKLQQRTELLVLKGGL